MRTVLRRFEVTLIKSQQKYTNFLLEKLLHVIVLNNNIRKNKSFEKSTLEAVSSHQYQ